MIDHYDITQDATLQEQDVSEENKKPSAHPFWAPFSWITVFVAGALFWYWIVGLLLKLS